MLVLAHLWMDIVWVWLRHACCKVWKGGVRVLSLPMFDKTKPIIIV